MAFTLALFFLALEVSAKVPHWVKQKSAFKVPSAKSLLPTPLRRLAKQTSNSRHLQGILSDNCSAACPGLADYMNASMTIYMEAEEGTEPDMNSVICDHKAALKCVGKEKACQDPEPEDGGEEEEGGGEQSTCTDDDANMDCMCACADSFTAMSNTTKMCASKDTVVGCLAGESTCSCLLGEMGGKAAADITCKRLDQDCDEKGMNMMECMGEDGMANMMTWGTTCSNDDGFIGNASNADTCCPIVTEMVACYSKECSELDRAFKKMQAGSSNTEVAEEAKKGIENDIQIGKMCPDAGLPTSEADFEAALSKHSPAAPGPSPSGGDTDTGNGTAVAADAPANAVPVLGLIAAAAAYFA